MWLSCSSVGRKLVMALSGACLVLFVTFHCVMNAIAILWPTAYNSICMFLGANWYALIASAGLALLVLVHIIYAVMLTLQNRKARGTQRYDKSSLPKNVEWSSNNMLVLGIVVVAFFVVHLIQFWAKMQLAEVAGIEGAVPASAGTLFIQMAFSQVWTPIVYLIGFVALWFHLNHGFWSMFQTIGWSNEKWIPRLKKVSCVWTSVVVLLFVAQAAMFTYRAQSNYYLTDSSLRDQYKDMVAEVLVKADASNAQLAEQIKQVPYDNVSAGLRQMVEGQKRQLEGLNSPEGQEYVKSNPQMKEEIEKMKAQVEILENATKLFDYLESTDGKPQTLPMNNNYPN